MKKLFVFLALLAICAIVFSSKTYAYSYNANTKWPGTYWTGANPEIYLSLEYAVNDKGEVIHHPLHNDVIPDANKLQGNPDLGFGIFFDGNITGDNTSTFTVNIEKAIRGGNTLCNTSEADTNIDMLFPVNSALPTWPGGGGKGFNCNDIPTTFNVSYNKGRYDFRTNTTVFEFKFWLNVSATSRTKLINAKNWDFRGISFYVESSAGKPGVLKNTPIAFIPNGSQGNFIDKISIDQGARCDGGGNFNINIYDADNNEKNRAQRRDKDDKNTYEPMYISVNHVTPDDAATVLDVGIGANSHGSVSGTTSWTDLYSATLGNYYEPKDQDSPDIVDIINYTFIATNAYQVNLLHYGERNYTFLQLPLDGVTNCPSPWDTTGGSSITPKTYIKTTASKLVTFNHSVTNIGPGPLTEDVNIVRHNYDGTTTNIKFDNGSAAGAVKDASHANIDIAGWPAGKYCEHIDWYPKAIYDTTSHPSTTSTCIVIVDITSPVITAREYEKGKGALTMTSGNVFFDIGTSDICPDEQITISYTFSGTGVTSGSGSFNFGGAAGCGSPSNPVNLPLINTGTLDIQPPGTTYTINLHFSSSTVNGTTYSVPDSVATFAIVEVPYARFYGNDVIARSGEGEIRFNAADSFSGMGQGSVSQYTAMANSARNTIKLASAAFRGGYTYTKPTDDLKSNNNGVPKSIPEMISKDIHLPDGCSTFDPGPIPSIGCYNLTGSHTLNSITTNGGKITYKTSGDVVIGGDIKNTQSFSSEVVKIYEHVGSEGWVESLVPGEYSSTQAGYSSKIPAMSSLQIPNNQYKVTLYSNSNYTGTNVTLTSSSANLNDFRNISGPGGPGVGWNDQVRSLRVELINPSININYGAVLIVAKNIYIKNNVSQVDAILIAENNIYTCTNDSTLITTSQRSSLCRNNLTINGAIAAPNIKFERSSGTRLLGSDGDNGGIAGSNNIGARTLSPDANHDTSKAAEIINFPAYLYFVHPYLKDTSDTLYNSLTTSAPRY